MIHRFWYGIFFEYSKEEVFFNGQLINTKRNLLSRTGVHTFKCDDIEYKVKIKVTSLWKGEIEATLYASGLEVDRASLKIEDEWTKENK